MKNLHWPIVYLKLVAAGNVIQYNVILQKIEVHYISCKYKDNIIQYISFRSTLIIIMSRMFLWHVWIFPFFVWFQFYVVDKGSIQSQAGRRQNVWHDAFHCVVDITTQFGDSSTGNSFIFCLELQYFLSIWKYFSNAVHHCTLVLVFPMKVQICITLRDVFGGGAYVHLAANVSWCILTEQQLSAPTDFEFLPWDVFVFHTFHRSAYYPYLYIHTFSRSVFVVRTFSRSTFVFCTFSGNAYLYLCFILLVDMHIMLICICVSRLWWIYHLHF